MANKILIKSSANLRIMIAQRRALLATADQIVGDVNSNQTVPKDTGALEDSVMIKSDLSGKRVRISYNTPYARRLYFHPELNFNRALNINAGAGWLDTYKDGSGNEWVISTFSKMLEREMK